MKVDNTYLNIYKPNAIFNHLGKVRSLARNDIDRVDVNFSSLLKSRKLSLNQPQQDKNVENVKNVEAVQSIQKPDAGISDEKWNILVKIAEAKGITDPEAIANMKLSDIGESRTYMGGVIQHKQLLFLPGVGESLEDTLKESGMTIKELLAGWGTVYERSDSAMYDAKLADADVSALTALYEGIESNDKEKINSSVNQILKKSDMYTIIHGTGQKYTPPVDKAKTLEYFAKGAALTDDPSQDRFKVGLLSELEDLLGGSLEDLTLNDLGNYIDQFKNAAEIEITGISATDKDLDTKLVDLDRYSLYNIVEGIKQNNGSLFNEGLVDRK